MSSSSPAEAHLRYLLKTFQDVMCQRNARRFVNAFDEYALDFLGVVPRHHCGITGMAITANGDTLDSATEAILGVPYTHVIKIKGLFCSY